MSRLPAVDPTRAIPEVQAVLGVVNSQLGITPNLFKVAANSAATLNALVQMSGALAKGQLRPRVRETIALAVAELNGCDYCLSAHSFLGKAAGLSDQELTAARNGEAADPHTAAVLKLASEIVRTRGHVGAETIEEVKRAGVTDTEIAEVVGNVVVNVFTNYLNLVAGTDIDFPVVRAAAPARA